MLAEAYEEAERNAREMFEKAEKEAAAAKKVTPTETSRVQTLALFFLFTPG